MTCDGQWPHPNRCKCICRRLALGTSNQPTPDFGDWEHVVRMPRSTWRWPPTAVLNEFHDFHPELSIHHPSNAIIASFEAHDRFDRLGIWLMPLTLNFCTVEATADVSYVSYFYVERETGITTGQMLLMPSMFSMYVSFFKRASESQWTTTRLFRYDQKLRVMPRAPSYDPVLIGRTLYRAAMATSLHL